MLESSEYASEVKSFKELDKEMEKRDAKNFMAEKSA
jgi:hypothetical protein